jgi:hypothetical protein
MRTGGEPALYHICPSHVKRNYHKFCQFGVMCIDPGHKVLTHFSIRHPLHWLLCRQKRGQPSLSAVLANIDPVKAATVARTKAKRMVREDVIMEFTNKLIREYLGRLGRTPCFYIAPGPDHPLQVSNRLQSAKEMPADCHLTSTVPGRALPRCSMVASPHLSLMILLLAHLLMAPTRWRVCRVRNLTREFSMQGVCVLPFSVHQLTQGPRYELRSRFTVSYSYMRLATLCSA